ncbi:Hypothetical protein CRIB_852 [Romboutsia ilealis]|uniref:Uncharacterized protein n=1 Tax=Romboutsia ilealis TaxID=1115758 RepID=A0A1V1I2F4_9FIRM|nr:Hypothetical protein CRIB_852 [Romboutsia ilealis]
MQVLSITLLNSTLVYPFKKDEEDELLNSLAS